MSRQFEFDRRHRGWRDLALAGAAAGAVTLLLVAAVGLVWLLGRSPSQAPVLAGQSQSTPTPRALTFVRNTPTPAASAPDEVPTATVVTASEEEAAEPAPTVVATPELLTMSTESDRRRPAMPVTASCSKRPAATSSRPLPRVHGVPQPTPSSTQAAAPSRSRGWSSPLCRAQPSRSRPRFVSTASSIRSAINRLDSPPARQAPIRCSVVDSSFRASDTARARLTDVSLWEDGYNADPVLAEEDFDPGDDWHTYRFELRGSELRLLIDGADVVSGTLEAPIDPASTDARRSLGTGRGAEVRKVSVLLLPPA